jgi:hypothetical protein
MNKEMNMTTFNFGDGSMCPITLSVYSPDLLTSELSVIRSPDFVSSGRTIVVAVPELHIIFRSLKMSDWLLKTLIIAFLSFYASAVVYLLLPIS